MASYCRCVPMNLGRFDLPVPRHHGIARFGIGRAAVEEGPERSERDDPHIAAIAWSQLGTKIIAADLQGDQRPHTLTLLLLPLSQAYSRAPAVLVDELDAGRLERPAYR